MYVIPEYKFAFLAAPRTGSKAVAKVLMKRGAILIGGHHTLPEANPEFKIGSDWTVCMTVRNHWDAMISWYFKIERHGKKRPLAEFLPTFCLNNPNFVRDNQLWWAASHTNTILRYEHLQNDLNTALVKAGMAPLELERVSDSQRNGAPYQIFYKQQTARWVGVYFEEEIAKYGYKF